MTSRCVGARLRERASVDGERNGLPVDGQVTPTSGTAARHTGFPMVRVEGRNSVFCSSANSEFSGRVYNGPQKLTSNQSGRKNGLWLGFRVRF